MMGIDSSSGVLTPTPMRPHTLCWISGAIRVRPTMWNVLIAPLISTSTIAVDPLALEWFPRTYILDFV